MSTTIKAIQVDPSTNQLKEVTYTVDGSGGSGSGGTTTPATTTVLGLVELADTPTTASAPKALITESASVTSAANKLVRAGSDGKIDAGWLPAGSGGGTSGVSSINAKTNAVIVTGTGGIAINSTTNGFAVDGSGITGGGGGAPTSTYRATVLADSPIAYYKLDEAAGATVAADEVASGHAGAYGSGMQTGVPGVLAYAASNRAAYFSGGTGATVTITPWSGLPSGATTRSVEVWFCQTTPGNRRVIGWGTFSSGQEWSLSVYNGNLILDFNGSSVAGPAISPGVWYHAVATYDGTTAILYVNGVLIASNATTLSTGSAVFDIGGSNGFFGSWIGLVDEPAAYNTALTQPQIIAHFLAGRP